MLYMIPWPMFSLVLRMNDAGLSMVLYYAHFALLFSINAHVS